MKEKREYWIDYIKMFACVLVALGHFFQSVVKANIIPDHSIYRWFNGTIYYFHVPLFFICSGYLYQKYSRVDNVDSWKKNVIKKAIVLGVPYFVFSVATWILKTFFAETVNNQVGGSLGYTLFSHPMAPYWYLYILFLLFVITPTVKSKKGIGILAGAAIAAKLLVLSAGNGCRILSSYVVLNLLSNWIWFVIGMLIAFCNLQKRFSKAAGALLGSVFLLASIWSYKTDNSFLSFGMGLLACAAVCMTVYGGKESKSLDWFAKYTMPIFLMHTLFAAPCRILLMKLGVGSAVIHIGAGIAISFAGPIAAMVILEKIKLDFLVYPKRLMRILPSRRQRKDKET